MGVPRVTPGALSRALGEAYSEGAARWYGAGRWRAGIRVPLVSPWGREVVAHVETPSPRGIVETLEAVAFSWDELASMDEDELLDTLREVGDELLSRADDLAALVAAEAGMTASEAADEVARAADLVEHAAGLGVSEKPQKGVVLAVAPFTSPLATVAASVAYALVNRMPVIVKLPMKAPLAGLALADILNEVGLGSFAAFLPAPAARAVSLVAPSEPVLAVVSYTSRYAAL
ncbi:MAG: aldehyde dehydrogenase family protein, partial [Desulfurococcales archaeon]|nr:aldehyde dehydrogenase family protein [Desulfurococcales archaeon]